MGDGCVSQHTLHRLSKIYVKITVDFRQKDQSLPRNSMSSHPVKHLWQGMKSDIWFYVNTVKTNKQTKPFGFF